MSSTFLDRQKIILIAEAGKNFIMKSDYNVAQCLDEAKNYARIAKECGADVVKFQTHVFADEQARRAESRHAWIKKNEELTPYQEFWVPLKAYCDKIGIEFLTTPMSKMAAKKVNDLVSVWKVGSAEVTDLALLEYLKGTGKPIILSSGMSTMAELDKAVQFLGNSVRVILHCVSIYPCPLEKLNLATIKFLQSTYPEKRVGFSDHSMGTKAAVYAADKLDATVIEKHFTLDRGAYGPDQHMSATPEEITELADKLEDVTLEKYAVGVFSKIIWKEELKHHEKFRTA